MTEPLDAAALLKELKGILPTEQISDSGAPSAEDKDEGAGERPGGRVWAVEPAAKAELTDLMKWANLRGAAVFTRHPRPGDARLAPRPRIYLRGRRMKRILDVDILSGTVTVQSGIAMADLHAALAERRFTTGFPTRPWGEASLGSVLAAALDAHWGPHFGGMEEHVAGLGVVFPDGRAARSRVAPRRAVGPDFDRLFLGSRGRYGIIYDATLRIYPCTNRVVLCYAANSLEQPLKAVRAGCEMGMDPRAVEILTPSLAHAWGRKRVGLTDAQPVLVLVEPWGPLAGLPTAAVDDHFRAFLEPLTPPVGWNVHEGLLPSARQWKTPVVAMTWAELTELSRALGSQIPPGLWIVRMNRHGAWISISDAMATEGVAPAGRAIIERAVAAHIRPSNGPWSRIADTMAAHMDPNKVLNPTPPGGVS